MYYKLLACDVLTRELAYCIARSPHTVSAVFAPKGEHNVPDRLRALLQAQIDAAADEDTTYDAVLLAYGLCGNAISGLTARKYPLVVPRAHDCTALFLGSKEAFREHFGDNPSRGWTSVGYSERGDSIISDSRTRDYLAGGQSYEELIAQYGEENALYFMEMLAPKHESDELLLLDVPETRVPAVVERIRGQAEAAGLRIRELPGSIRLIDMLVSGDWREEDFLVVPPGHKIAALYDLDRVVAAAPADAPSDD